MANPILGKDVILQFFDGNSYVNYGCATDVEIQFAMETKSVKTIGDGNWSRKRGQSKSYKVNLSGVIKADDDVPNAFDLLAYYKNMTDILFRILFIDETGITRTIEGYALPTDVNLGSGSEGHATGAITLEGNGDPDNPYTPQSPASPSSPGSPVGPTVCDAAIQAGHVSVILVGGVRRFFNIDSMVPGSATISRYDYSIDGGAIQSAFTDGLIPTQWQITVPGTNGSSHTIVVTPICDNGFSGTPYTLNFIKTSS